MPDDPGPRRVRFTRHARRRMARYGLVESDVRGTLAEPDAVLPGRRGRRIAQRNIGPDHLVRVVCEEREGLSVVVTVYLARRDRYEI